MIHHADSHSKSTKDHHSRTRWSTRQWNRCRLQNWQENIKIRCKICRCSLVCKVNLLKNNYPVLWQHLNLTLSLNQISQIKIVAWLAKQRFLITLLHNISLQRRRLTHKMRIWTWFSHKSSKVIKIQVVVVKILIEVIKNLKEVIKRVFRRDYPSTLKNQKKSKSIRQSSQIQSHLSRLRNRQRRNHRNKNLLNKNLLNKNLLSQRSLQLERMVL